MARSGSLFLLTMGCLLLATAMPPLAADGLERVKYNHPGLVVDLGVGLWAWPLPMDYDGDGDLDLVVSCPDVPYNGTYFFENTEGNVKLPVFKPGVRIERGLGNIQISHANGACHVLLPGQEARDFPRKGLGDQVALPVSINIYGKRARARQWKYCDYDGDGRSDLIVGVGDWSDYGWDNAFDSAGRWTRGPLHGFIYLLRNIGTSPAPRYDDPIKVEAGAKPVDVYGMPSPNFADFDGDGDLDLLCGEFVDKLTYFQNVGTRTEPKYAEGRFLLHDGKPLCMDLCMIVPVAVDWDKDGDVDLVVGEEDGRVSLLEHTGKVVDGMPQFLPQQQFRQVADNVKFGALVTPFSLDWDGDGDEDLICGNTAGYIGFIENLDGGNPPKWAAPKYVMADGKVIRILAGPNGSIQGPCEAKWGYTTLTVADWDHDGLPDLVVNSIWGKVHWYRNVGSRTGPRLAAAQPVEVEWPSDPPKPAWTWWTPAGKELATQWRTTPLATDLNKDGLTDLAMLDHEGYLAFFERQRQDGRLVLLPGKRVFALETSSGRRPLQLNAGEAGRSGRRKLCLTDWDGDGRPDLIANGHNADLLRCIAADGDYVFEKRGRMDQVRLAGHSTSPTVVDWDRDGKPDLLVGAEDGHLYYLAHRPLPTPPPLPARRSPNQHLVAAWDFEPGNGGPLADKATAGSVKDTLAALGDVRMEDGAAAVPRKEGAALRAASSKDLSPHVELTIWLRLCVDRNPAGFLGLVDKRRFRKPEMRSYGFYITPDAGKPNAFAIGGQVSQDGTADLATVSAKPPEVIPVGKWQEIAMVVRREEDRLIAEWFLRKDDARAGAWKRLSRCVEHPTIVSIHQSDEPLFIGNDMNLKAVTSPVRFDEVRIYNRALSLDELSAIRPGQMSKQ